jgi:ferredoxin
VIPFYLSWVGNGNEIEPMLKVIERIITGLKGNSITKDRNEPATLSKFGYEASDIRLSCQILISSDLDGATIEILE